MRRLGLILCTSLLAGCGLSSAADKADDARNWQGTWKLVSCTANGQAEMADMAWVVSGDRYTIRLGGQTGTDPYPFQLDPSHKLVDVNHHDTPAGTWGGKFKGIYEIKGDSLKVCYDLKGEKYPKSFDAGPGSGRVVYQFQREGR